MSDSFNNDLFMRAARGEACPRPPVWFMRQAGRTDPKYNALKEKAGKTLEDLFRDPDLAAEISLLPKRLGVDALIYFQDILTPLDGMGCPFVFRPGPVTDAPIRSAGDVDRLREYDVADGLPFIAETFRLIRKALDGEMPVLGFAGAPLTLAVFMIEGRSFGDTAPQAMAFLREEPEAAHRLLEKLTKVTIDFLRYQVSSGAAAVQLFESAAHLLTPDIYKQFALPYQQQIFEALRGVAPTIVFAREWTGLDELHAAGADILSLPAEVSITEAREKLGQDCIIQGNLDNHLLAKGSLEEIAKAVRECVDAGERRGHIFNLSHGLLRETPFENIAYCVEQVKNC